MLWWWHKLHDFQNRKMDKQCNNHFVEHSLEMCVCGYENCFLSVFANTIRTYVSLKCDSVECSIAFEIFNHQITLNKQSDRNRSHPFDPIHYHSNKLANRASFIMSSTMLLKSYLYCIEQHGSRAKNSKHRGEEKEQKRDTRTHNGTCSQ